MDQICGWYGISRQAHYQQRQRDAARQEAEVRVLAAVRAIRQKHPRMGARKLWQKLQKQGVAISRDKLLDLLRREGLLVRRRRARRRTTWPGPWRCENLLAEMTLTAPNQAWVCDITYIETEEGFGYLALVMDAYSRFILGYDYCDSLAVEGAQRALAMARRRARGPVEGIVHHSDRGIQYTCHAYRNALKTAHMLSSMGAVGNCYENAQAERLNGILKQEYALGDRFVDHGQVRRAVRQAVWLYNHDRPHLSLDYQTPVEVHYKSASLMPNIP